MLSDVSQFSETLKAQLYETYVKELRLRGYTDVTVKTYSRYVQRLFESGLSVSDFLMTFSHCVSTTVRLVYFSIERFYRFVLGEELRTAVPIAKRRYKLPIVISREDVQKLITTAGDRQLIRLIIKALYYSGMRVGELSRLTWEDIDFNRNMIHIKKTKGYKDRAVFLHPELRYELLLYRHNYREGGQTRGPVLFFENRNPVSIRAIQGLLARTRKKAGFTFSISPHTLRHTFAKNLVDTGTPLDQVALLLGHESLDTTKIYTHPSRRDLERAVRQAAGDL